MNTKVILKSAIKLTNESNKVLSIDAFGDETMRNYYILVTNDDHGYAALYIPNNNYHMHLIEVESDNFTRFKEIQNKNVKKSMKDYLNSNYEIKLFKSNFLFVEILKIYMEVLENYNTVESIICE